MLHNESDYSRFFKKVKGEFSEAYGRCTYTNIAGARFESTDKTIFTSPYGIAAQILRRTHGKQQFYGFAGIFDTGFTQ